MFKGSASRSGKIVALAGALMVASALSTAPTAQAGRAPSATYDVWLNQGMSPSTDQPGLFGDNLEVPSSYLSTSSWSFELAGGTERHYSITLGGGLSVPNFRCNVGMVFGGDNPLVTCYSDASKSNGYFIDFPPYGNDNKRNRAANPACAKFVSTNTGTTTEVPADCLAQVGVTIDGQSAGGYSGVSMPFTLTTKVRP